MSSDFPHVIPKRERRRLQLIFLAVVALHGLLLLVPSVRNEFVSRIDSSPLVIRLVAKGVETKQELDVPAVSAADAHQPSEPPSPETLTYAPPASESPAAKLMPTDDRADESVPENRASEVLVTRIMSGPYLDEEPPRLDPFSVDPVPRAGNVEFRYADRSTPDPLIYPEPVALPFADAPRFAVEFYDDGVMGGMQRFWDSVTFAKTWTTKNGTKVSCGVVLVIPACAWD